MKDMIAKIVDTEKEAEKLTEDVKNSRASVEQEIAELKEKIKTKYLTRARERIKKNQISEQDVADELLKNIQKNHSEILKEMEEKYSLEKDSWINSIINNVLGSE